jgi:hypothetical protein
MTRLHATRREAPAPGVAPDFIEASIIDARLRDILAKRRAQVAEARGERGERVERGDRAEPPAR